ncbi:MAG TPA: TraR/DksA C4-type zinc finger protein [Ilumatobacteraceae bacterium]|nr:TraR/DksA C4-type zinc finger protein [Ilumatobacteraceae bacterium]
MPEDPQQQHLDDELRLALEQVDELEQEYNQLVTDHGAIQEDRDAVRVVLESARQRVETARRAIERAAAGQTATCSRCGGAIEPERLDALPGVETCAHCAGAR